METCTKCDGRGWSMDCYPFIVGKGKNADTDHKWFKAKCSCHRGAKWYESFKNIEIDFALRMNAFMNKHCEYGGCKRDKDGFLIFSKGFRAGALRFKKDYIEGDRDIVDIFTRVFD
jgi:hypothetical protein